MRNGICSLLYLIWYKGIAELKAENTREYAGYLWWILNPLMSLAVYYVAFSIILKQGGGAQFVVFLFTGIVAYQWFASSVLRASGSLIGGAGLIQQVYVHKCFFPLTDVLVDTVKFVITLILLLTVTMIAGQSPTIVWIALPVLILIELVFITGCCLFCAALTPLFPDFQLILATIVQLLLFLSGVFFSLDFLPPNLKFIVSSNPLALLIEQFRFVLLKEVWPSWIALLYPLTVGIIIILLGLIILQIYDKRYPKIS